MGGGPGRARCAIRSAAPDAPRYASIDVNRSPSSARIAAAGRPWTRRGRRSPPPTSNAGKSNRARPSL